MARRAPHSRPPEADRATYRARLAVAALFLTNGAVFANILPRYPGIKEELALSSTAYGFAVAAFPAGALVAGLAAGAAIRRFHSARVAVAGMVVTSLGVLLAGIAPSGAVFVAALCVAGGADAITDVAQNAHGLQVQRRYQRSILNSFHAVWSIGAVLGGLMAAGAIALDVPRGLHLGTSAALFSAVVLAVYPFLLADAEEPPDAPPPANEASGTRAPRGVGRFVPVAALVLLAVCGAVVEDAGSSWASVYLSGPLGATATIASFGYIALVAAQFVGRLVGDGLVDRFGQRTVARTGGLLAAVGMGLALAVPTVPGTIAGFGVAGLGVATLVPAVFEAADRLPGFRRGTGLAIVSWLMRIGFLASPPIVGLVADAGSLRGALLVVPLAGLTVALLACALSDARRRIPVDAP